MLQGPQQRIRNQRSLRRRIAVLVVALAALALSVSPTPASAVIGGRDADPNEAPWMVALLDPESRSIADGQVCGGVLISPRRVVTAGHCLLGEGGRFRSDGPFAMRASPKPSFGIQIARTRILPDGKGQRYRVRTAAIYPSYAEGEFGIRGDIAVLYLSQPQPGPYLPLAKKGDGSWQAGSSMTVYGWGATDLDRRENPTDFPNELQAGTVRRFSDRICRKRFGSDYDPKRHICAGGTKTNETDACEGDSGGPLVGKNLKGEQVLSGIVSWGDSCADARYPGVYTRVATYRHWVMSLPPGRGLPDS